MLSLENIRYYCRTCLVKLEITNENEETKKFVVTNKYPKLEHLMDVCLAKTATNDNDANLSFYAPYLCRSCFDKWLDFVHHYELAVKNEAKIWKVVKSSELEPEIKEDNVQIFHDDQNFNRFFIQTEPMINISEVEKYETTSPFYTDSHSNSHSTSKVQHNAVLYNSLEDPTLLTNPNKCKISTAEIFKSEEESTSSDELNSIKSETLPTIMSKKSSRSAKSNQKSKTFCKLRKKYKTRKSLLAANVSHGIEKNLNETTENITKKIRYQCEPCNKYFWEKNKYNGHMKQVHEGIRRPYQCQQCDKTYNLYKTLLQHTRECHTEKSQETYKCDECNKTFKTAVILKQHLLNKHAEQTEGIRSICDQCGFIAANQYSLSQHIKNKHTETDHIKCEECPKVFKTHYSLKYHMMGFHNPMNIKPFKCPECDMGFTRKTLLNQHRRTHLKYTERIKCDFEGCEVRFVKRGDKTHHMRLVHLKVKQHVCDFCGEAFGAMQTLRHHRFIHTGEKPYKCNVCGQGFRQRTAMKTHRKTHFGKDTERQDLINNLPEIDLNLVHNLNL